MAQDTARKPRGRTAQAEESYEVIKAQEALIVEVQTGIAKALRERNLKQLDLANRLGVSQARVSQMFGDDAQNLTLRTLAKIYQVLGSRCQLVEAPVRQQPPATDHVEAHAADPLPGTDDAMRLGEEAVLRYRFHRAPTSDQLAAKRKFEVRRRCVTAASAVELAHA